MDNENTQIEITSTRPGQVGRRHFLRLGGGLTTSLLVAVRPQAEATAQTFTAPPTVGQREASTLRIGEAYDIRIQAAERLQGALATTHPTNGDEVLYPNHIANFSKTLPHNALGEVEPMAYQALLDAMTGKADCEAIPLGGEVRLANPQAAFAFHLEGMDTHNLTMPPPPAFASAECAAEMVELYWQALTRDVPFAHYGQEPLTEAAVAELRRFPSYRQVDTGTLFRGATPGDWVGPYLSQFLTLPVPYGALTMQQQYQVPMAGDDHMTTVAEWLAIQNGALATKRNSLERTPHYLRTARDLGEWVHADFTHQAFLNASLMLNKLGKGALNPKNPYLQSANQGGFVTFGAADVLSMVTGIACAALKAAWAQKWLFHRRLRPEEFGGRVHQQQNGKTTYPLHASLLETEVLTAIDKRFGSYLLPIAYPEGCPAHPAYPAGHAVIAGACVTVLKACYNEALILPDPQVVAEDGLSIQPYRGSEALTVGGELNKLAANVALGRNAAGVHWRSDALEGLLLGESLAISVLADLALTYHEKFDGFMLTRFDGRRVVVGV